MYKEVAVPCSLVALCGTDQVGSICNASDLYSGGETGSNLCPDIAILAEVYRGVSQSLQSNARTVPQTKSRLFPSTLFISLFVKSSHSFHPI
jgi:hypothetical protein